MKHFSEKPVIVPSETAYHFPQADSSVLMTIAQNAAFDNDEPLTTAATIFLMPDQGTLLYRPVGQKELDLIALTGFTAFPPRLEGQPIFYPVLNEEYASFIAREWNTVDAASGYVGYVLRFTVDSAYISHFGVQKVGSASALEYWIPAEQLDEFNSNIIGKIDVISTFRPDHR